MVISRAALGHGVPDQPAADQHRDERAPARSARGAAAGPPATAGGLRAGMLAHARRLLPRRAGRVPHQPRIEGLGGEHGQDHHAGEGDRAEAGVDGDQPRRTAPARPGSIP